MRNIGTMIFLFFLFPLTGCLSFGEYSEKFDYKNGLLECGFHNIRSVDRYRDTEADWQELKRFAQGEKSIMESEFPPNVMQKLSQQLFQEGKNLSGKENYRVVCPACFSSKVAALESVYKKWKELRLEMINNEIFVMIPKENKIISTNGKKLETQRNNIIVWSEDTEVFEYRIKCNIDINGESLLPFYLKENKK